MDEILRLLGRSDSKLDEIQKDISEIKITMTKNTSDIAHHIRRSDLAEESIELLRADLKPIKNHISFVKGALWCIGVVGAVVMALNELGILKKIF